MELRILIKDAIEVLKQNREKHIEDYKEALGVWREAHAEFTKVLEEWAASEAGSSYNKPQEPSRPRNYLGEYDKLIAKLGRHRDETIILNDNEYSIIFEDNFYWQGSFQRQKAPIYTMGSPDPKGFTRGQLSANSITASSLNADKLDGFDSNHVPLEDE
jgi:hypothetical protein